MLTNNVVSFEQPGPDVVVKATPVHSQLSSEIASTALPDINCTCSSHRGDSNEYTQYTIFNMNKKDTINYPKSAAMGFYPRDSRMSLKQPW